MAEIEKKIISVRSVQRSICRYVRTIPRHWIFDRPNRHKDDNCLSSLGKRLILDSENRNDKMNLNMYSLEDIPIAEF